MSENATTTVAEKNKTEKAPATLKGALAVQQAVKDNKALAYKSQDIIPLALFVATENPRQEPANLYREGLVLVDPKNPKTSIVHMALSDDIEDVKRLVEMVEKHENDVPEDESDEASLKPDAEGERRPQSIVSLARSLRETQLQPVNVRAGKAGYTLVFGQRRLAAKAYLHAKSRLDVHNKVKGAKIVPPTIMGSEVDVTKEQAFDMAVAENRDRKDFTPLQWAAIIHEYTKRKNPDSKKPFTLKEVASKLFGNKQGAYALTRSRHALLLPRTEPKYDDEGNMVKPGKGLTDEDRARLDRGEMGLTFAVRKALGENHTKGSKNKDGTKTTGRDRPLPLKDMQALFDETAENNIERRKAIAECMGLTLDKAEKQSEERIQAAEKADMRKSQKEKKKGKKGKKSQAEGGDDATQDEAQEPVGAGAGEF